MVEWLRFHAGEGIPMNRFALPFVQMLMAGVLIADANAEAERPPFKSLRYDEDYRFLQNPSERSGFWDALKYLPVLDGRAGYLSVGGELRERFESYENEFFSANPDADNAYLMQRYLLHADFHASERFRIFGQLQSSLEDGRPGGPRPTDRNAVDLHQLFGDLVMLTRNDQSLTLRVGRQEMSYGSERLISVREGTNSRRAFDAVRLLYRKNESSLDLFFSSPVEVDTGVFDDQHIRDLWFWGAYATLPLLRCLVSSSTCTIWDWTAHVLGSAKAAAGRSDIHWGRGSLEHEGGGTLIMRPFTSLADLQKVTSRRGHSPRTMDTRYLTSGVGPAWD